jgi:hypothetical protein
MIGAYARQIKCAPPNHSTRPIHTDTHGAPTPSFSNTLHSSALGTGRYWRTNFRHQEIYAHVQRHWPLFTRTRNHLLLLLLLLLLLAIAVDGRKGTWGRRKLGLVVDAGTRLPDARQPLVLDLRLSMSVR